MSPRRALLLAEAGAEAGYGHLSRTGALAAALRDAGWETTLLARGRAIAASALRDAEAEACDWTDPAFAEHPALARARLVAFDSYTPDRPTLERLRGERRALFFDDDRRLDYPPGLVVNGAPGAETLGYRDGGATLHLLGPRYLALRRPFLDAAARHALRPKVSRILIAAGGVDAHGLLPSLARAAAAAHPEAALELLCGAAPGGADGFPARTFPRAGLRAPELADLMAGCDLAVASGGQTLCELARVGVPAVAVLTAENQAANLRGLASAGCVAHAGARGDPHLPERVRDACARLADPAERGRLREACAALFPGDGAREIVRRILEGEPA